MQAEGAPLMGDDEDLVNPLAKCDPTYAQNATAAWRGLGEITMPNAGIMAYRRDFTVHY